MTQTLFYEIIISKYVALSTKDRPCYDDGSHQTLAECKRQYYLKVMGCYLPWEPVEGYQECDKREHVAMFHVGSNPSCLFFHCAY